MREEYEAGCRPTADIVRYCVIYKCTLRTRTWMVSRHGWQPSLLLFLVQLFAHTSSGLLISPLLLPLKR